MIPKMITIHCTDSPNGKWISVQEIREWHMKERGFDDIGYHFVVATDGGAWPARPMDRDGAHVLNHNKDNIGIVMEGTDQFLIVQWESTRSLVNYLMKRFKIPLENVRCHNEFDTAISQGKTCPGFSGEVLRTFLADPESTPPKQYICYPSRAG